MEKAQSFCNALLDCGHSFTFENGRHPRVRDYMFCTRCSKGRTVVASHDKQWFMKCYECSHTAYTGQDEDHALLKQIRHRQNSGHTNTKVGYSNGSDSGSDPIPAGHGNKVDATERYLF